MTTKRELLVRSIELDDIVHRVDVTGKSDRDIDRVMRGMLINLNLEKFWIDDTAASE